MPQTTTMTTHLAWILAVALIWFGGQGGVRCFVVSSSDCQSTSVDVTFLLDDSTATEERHFQEDILFAVKVVIEHVWDRWGNAVRFALLVNNGVSTRVVWNLNDTTLQKKKTALLAAVDGIVYRGGASGDDDEGTEGLSRENALEVLEEQVVPLLRTTSSNSTLHAVISLESIRLFFPAHNRAKFNYLVSSVFVIGSKEFERYKYEIAASKVENVLVAENGPDLATQAEQLANLICATTPLRYSGRWSNFSKSVDLTFVLQDSHTVSIEYFYQVLKPTVKNVVKTFRDVGHFHTRVGIVTYGSTVDVRFNLDALSSALEFAIMAINDVQYRGELEAADLTEALKLVERSVVPKTVKFNVPHLVLVMSDGQARQDVGSAARNLQSNVTKVFVIGLGNETNVTNLNMVASQLEFSIGSAQFEQEPMKFIFKMIEQASQPLLLSKIGQCSDTGKAIDIAIVLSESLPRSWSALHFQVSLKNALKKLINGLWDESGRYNVRFALLLQGDSMEVRDFVNVVINLDTVVDKYIVFNALDSIQFQRKWETSWNLALAMKQLEKEVLPKARKGDVPFAVLIIAPPGFLVTEVDIVRLKYQQHIHILMVSDSIQSELIASRVEDVLILNSVNDLEMEVNIEKVSGRVCSAAVRPAPPVCPTSRTVDMTFVLQDSLTLGSDPQQQKIHLVVQNVIKAFFDSPQLTLRPSLLTFDSQQAQIHFHLDSYGLDDCFLVYQTVHRVAAEGRQQQSGHSRSSSSSSSGGGGNLSLALQTVREQIVPRTIRMNVPHLVLVLTDGQVASAGGGEDLAKQAQLLKDTGAKLMVMEVGDNAMNSLNIAKLASRIDLVISQPNVGNPDYYTRKIINVSCEPVWLEPYYAHSCPLQQPTDIVFVLDDSQAMSLSYFNIYIKNAVKIIIHRLWPSAAMFGGNQHHRQVRFALLLFGEEAHFVWNVNQSFSDQRAMFDEVDNVQYRGSEVSHANKDSALRLVKQEVMPLSRQAGAALFVVDFYALMHDSRLDTFMEETEAVLYIFGSPNEYNSIRFASESVKIIKISDYHKSSLLTHAQGFVQFLCDSQINYWPSKRIRAPSTVETSSSSPEASSYTTSQLGRKSLIPVDMTFAVDQFMPLKDGSFQYEWKQSMLRIIHNLETAIGEGNLRVSLITTMADPPTQLFDFRTFSENRTQALRVITNQLQVSSVQQPRILEALQWVMHSKQYAESRRVGALHVIVLFSTGNFQLPATGRAEMEKLKQMGSYFLCVGVGSSISRSTLRIIASEENFVISASKIPHVASISNRVKDLIFEITNQRSQVKWTAESASSSQKLFVHHFICWLLTFLTCDLCCLFIYL